MFFQESKTLRRWLNIATGSALCFITVVGIWKANPETLKAQPFLLDGSNGVSLLTMGLNTFSRRISIKVEKI